MGYTRQLGQLAYLITYDGSGNITVPASLTQGSVTSSMLKTDVGGKLVAAVAGTDYVAPSALSSYVPTTRTITINGTAYDLSADRSWSIVSGVSSFNTRTGAITLTSGDVTGALGYTPANANNYLQLTGGTLSGSLITTAEILSTSSIALSETGTLTNYGNYTNFTGTTNGLKFRFGGGLTASISFNTFGPIFKNHFGASATIRHVSGSDLTYDLPASGGTLALTSDIPSLSGYVPTTRTLTINGTTYDLSANRSWSIVAGLSSFNTRTGAITLLDTDVTGALGYTPVTNARTITINGTTYDLSANRTWVVDTSSVTTRVIQKFTATSSQTTFTITGGYTVGMVDVFLNGIKLDNAVDFTATDGSVVTLAVGAATGDIVEVYKYGGQFIANNTLRQSTLFTATAGQTTFTVNYSVGFVDVFYNGSKLDSSEFTATNGTSIILGTACVLNDKVEVIAYNYTVGAFTGVGGSGTAGYHAKWTATGTLNNSLIYESGTSVYIGATSGAYASAILYLKANSSIVNIPLYITGDNGGRIARFGTSDYNDTSTGSTLRIGFGASTGNTYASLQSWISGETAYGNLMLNPTSGRVGINMTNPSAALNVQVGTSSSYTGGGPGDSIRVSSGSTNAWMSAEYNGVTAYYGAITSGSVKFAGYNYASGSNVSMELGQGAMFISSAGRITMPYQPAFMAYGADSVASDSYWRFPSTTLNRGNHYNPSTGIFTAPVAGVYEFSWCNLGGQSATVYRYFLYVNNAELYNGLSHQIRMDMGFNSASAYGTSFTKTVLISLAANDTVRIYFRSDNGSNSYPYSASSANEYPHFMGKLIG